MSDLQSVIGEMEAMGTAQNRKVYRRHGVLGDQFGVSYADLGKLAKRLKTNHALAGELWATGNHDARVLACRLCDPAAADDALLDAWVADCDSYVLADALSAPASRAGDPVARHERWRDDDREWVGRTAWLIVAHLANRESDEPDDDWYASRLPIVERQVHGRANRVRDAMVLALIAIGARSDELEAAVAAAGERIGDVEVDHGETGCKTPDMGPYLHKTRAHRRKKQQKAAAGKA